LTCHVCNVETFKFGFHKGFQRYRCRTCGKTFSDIKRPLDSMRIDPEKGFQVIRMLCEGIGIRSAERLSGLNRRTVLSVLATAGEKCARLLDGKIRSVPVRHVETDELYSYVGCRPENAEKNHPEKGEFYCYLSMARDSKLILNFLIGKRNRDNCAELMHDLKDRVSTRIQLSTDGYTGYGGQYSVGAVCGAFKREIDWATETKFYGPQITEGPRRFNPMVCKWVKRTAKIGNPDLSQTNTSRGERMNLTFRLFNRRFTRCTMGYSKTLANHKHSTALLVAYYNFCRVHSAHGKTPAMAAGITEHVWTVEEMLSSGF
jgi:transposase-like protein/IS1 family transposase